MINYTEKGTGLFEVIEAAGHYLWEVDGYWVSSDDEAVQSIIDNYEHRPTKLEGFEFEGVYCSATRDDQAGLTAVGLSLSYVDSTNFHFENGNTLLLTNENYKTFMSAWVPFRQSFF